METTNKVGSIGAENSPKKDEDKKLTTENQYKEPEKQEIKSNNLVVYVTRIIILVGISILLFKSGGSYSLIFILLLLASEILEFLATTLLKSNKDLKLYAGIFLNVFGLLLITAIAYVTGWTTNDFYLVYLLYVSGSIVLYGTKIGIFSSLLAIFGYSLLLYLGHGDLILFLRLPLLILLASRFLTNQDRWEKTDEALKKLLGVEKSKQDFIALAAHNLRTPVAAIYGYIDILTRGDAGALNKEQNQYIERIKSNNHQLEKLTEELLQISILEIGKEVNLLKQATQIEVVIENVVERLDSMAKTKSITLAFKKQAGLLPVVNIDIEKIQSVISNLIDNAIKYTQQGGVIIEAKQEGNNVIVLIKDTGVGISASELPKVFNKFFRSGNLLIYNQTGVGLGLYLGKKIVEIHGGTMSVESSEGKGSTFSFSLPILKEDVLE